MNAGLPAVQHFANSVVVLGVVARAVHLAREKKVIAFELKLAECIT